MKKIFITGGTGFIGKEIINRLTEKKDVELYAITRNPKAEIQNVNILHGNIFDEDFLEASLSRIQPKYLLHLAWDVKGADYYKSKNNTCWKEISKYLLERFLAHGGEHVVASGTCFEYNTSLNIPHKETEIANPDTPYGKSKFETYQYFQELCNKRNARLVWGRIFYPYGKGEDPRKLFSAVHNALIKGQVFICKTPENIIDYIHVGDVADIFACFLSNHMIQGIVNVGTGDGKRIRDLLIQIARQIGRVDLLRFETGTDPKKIIVADVSRLKKLWQGETKDAENIDIWNWEKPSFNDAKQSIK